MDLPFCKICGDKHRLGHCPEWEEPPPRKPRDEKAQAPAVRRQDPEAEGSSAAAQDQGREIFDVPARPYTPDDMKQETMPVSKPRFDRNAYQRELMRKRRHGSTGPAA
jgi:hypothetical protein